MTCEVWLTILERKYHATSHKLTMCRWNGRVCKTCNNVQKTSVQVLLWFSGNVWMQHCFPQLHLSGWANGDRGPPEVKVKEDMGALIQDVLGKKPTAFSGTSHLFCTRTQEPFFCSYSRVSALSNGWWNLQDQTSLIGRVSWSHRMNNFRQNVSCVFVLWKWCGPILHGTFSAVQVRERNSLWEPCEDNSG